MLYREKFPLVSILVPIYNVEKYIERCVRSVFEQTYNNLEYVFVDDGSSDSSIDILKKVILDYPSQQEKTVVIYHQQNKGLAAARNTAITSCQGDFVIHVDSDDFLEQNAVELLVKKQQETDADFVYTTGYYWHKQIIKKISCRGWLTEKEPLLTNLLQDKATISIWGKLIKRNLYTDNCIRCDERGSYYEDFQVLPRLIFFSKNIACLDDYIYHYERTNSNSFVTNIPYSIEIQKQGLLSIKVVCDFFQDKEHQYYNWVKKFHLRYMYRMLNKNCKSRNKNNYNEFLQLIKKTERKYWHIIGWNRPLQRVIDSNYYIKSTTYPLYFLLTKFWEQRKTLSKKISFNNFLFPLNNKGSFADSLFEKTINEKRNRKYFPLK